MSPYYKQTDEKLMQLLSSGHLNCAAELFERYHVRLFNFFLYQGLDKNVSEDLVQMVFERLIRYRASFRGGMPFKAWLFQIARNVKYDLNKKKKLRISDFIIVENLEMEDQRPEESLKKEQQVNLLYQALEKLNPDQREILLLTRFQQLKYSEVASMLSISESAVKVKVHRALKQLRKHYFKTEQL